MCGAADMTDPGPTLGAAPLPLQGIRVLDASRVLAGPLVEGLLLQCAGQDANGATRIEQDMRLAVFNYPFTGWADSVVMNLLMGTAVVTQLEELRQVSYQPLAEAFRDILKVETHHAKLAEDGVAALVEQGENLQASVDYWMPRVGVSFGIGDAGRLEQLKAMGLRRQDNATLKSAWEGRIRPILDGFGLEG